MFQQVVDPLGNLFATWLMALVPVVLLLALLAVFRVSAWLATLIGSIVTYLLAVAVWHMPVGDGATAYIYGSLSGVWNVDWITLWGVMLFNTLVVTGVFEKFRVWLIAQGTADVRVQTMLFAWAFGAMLEGLVGFGYPWAFVAPILISLGIPDLDAIRVAAIANNAPVSFGALGAPLIALATVTGIPLLTLSSSVGHVVALLALLPPWILLYLVSGKEGMWEAWPLALVGSLGYVIGQLPVAVYFGPYVPDVAGGITCFASLLILLRLWRPKTVRGYGGKTVSTADQAKLAGGGHGLTANEIMLAWLPFVVLIVIVVAWTGPWSWLPAYVPFPFKVAAGSSIVQGQVINAVFNWAPLSGGTAIMVCWVVVSLLLVLTGHKFSLSQVIAKTWHQMWGALLVGVFIFGLAYVFNFSGMAGSLAFGFSKIGTWFIIVAPLLGWIGVALSGSNTSTNAMFGKFQAQVGQILGFPPVLLPTLNSLGAEIGKPVAPQTASVGVSTSRFVRNEGAVIRHNMGWTFVLLGYLVLLGIGFYFIYPTVILLK